MPPEAGAVQMQQQEQEHACIGGKLPFWILAFTESLVYRGDISGQEQIRPVAAGFFERGGAAPFCNFGVVAADEDFRNFPAAEVRGTRVVREIQQNVIRNSSPVARKALCICIL